MPCEVKVLSTYMLNGLTFSTFTQHRGNSFILVHCPSLPSIPAQIESMLQTPSNDTFFVAWYVLKPISDDPFEKYPILQSSLWSQDLGQVIIVKPQDVECHFACLAFEWYGTDSVAVVSLSQVFPHFHICLNQYLPLFCRNASYYSSCIAHHCFILTVWFSVYPPDSLTWTIHAPLLTKYP